MADPTSGIAPAIGRRPAVVGFPGGTIRESGFAIYDNIAIAQAATVTSAKINIGRLATGTNDIIMGRWAYTGTPTNGTYNARGAVYGEDIDDATEYTSYSQLDSATRTTANVTFEEGGVWTGPSTWTPDHAAGSPYEIDVTAIVQEVVNRSGWASGNAIQFFYDESGSDYSESTPKHAVWAVLSEYGTSPSAPGTLNIVL